MINYLNKLVRHFLISIHFVIQSFILSIYESLNPNVLEIIYKPLEYETQKIYQSSHFSRKLIFIIIFLKENI